MNNGYKIEIITHLQNKNGKFIESLNFILPLGPSETLHCLSWFCFFFFAFFFFRAALLGYGGSQARSQIGATAATLCHSHSDMGSELHL